MYCLLDDHDQFGNKLALITQDLIFQYVTTTTSINPDTFEHNYETELTQLFHHINEVIINHINTSY